MYTQMERWVCFSIGFVFLTSGIIKLIVSDFKTIFTNLGLPFPELTLFLIAFIEIACGMLITARMYIKQAAPPLILIMLGAIFLTKLPILSNGGLLSFAFEARLDIVMLILLLIIWRNNRVLS
ncbi:DoxX family protein [Oceanobacillus piezotolerans]|uniref:DoxX family protein n=1 Tax=Oceanobacillus piezotolerans TaxID=2448030 RepID=A0A498D7I6_9BACI|nr:DoxX family protein [Oceanobacillus piezotolerans]RLL41767.1 DoxX family protein [Oceanobacillus piezotolerans]